MKLFIARKGNQIIVTKDKPNSSNYIELSNKNELKELIHKLIDMYIDIKSVVRTWNDLRKTYIIAFETNELSYDHPLRITGTKNEINRVFDIIERFGISKGRGWKAVSFTKFLKDYTNEDNVRMDDYYLNCYPRLTARFILKHLDKITSDIFDNPIYETLPSSIKLLLKTKFNI